MNYNPTIAPGRHRAAALLMIASSVFLASCAHPPRIRYLVDQSLLPDPLRAKLQDDFPRYRVESASIDLVGQSAPAYHFELVSSTGETFTREVALKGRYRPRVSFVDRNRDGVIDFESRHFPMPGDRDWKAYDDDYDGYYDRRRWLGYHSWNVPVRIPVSTRIEPAISAVEGEVPEE